MRSSDIAQVLDICISNKRPAFIWGPPGVGKSDTVAQVAERRGMQLTDVRLNLLDPTDIKGFPMPDTATGQMHWLPANFLPPMMLEKEVPCDQHGVQLYEGASGYTYEDGKVFKETAKNKVQMQLMKVPNDSTGILFLDELNQAPPMVQAASYQLLLNRAVGDYKLPDGWAILAAGNRESDRSNAQRMPAALSLRLTHVDYDVNVDDWCDWALDQGDAVPVELLAFIRFRPDLLHKFDATQRSSPNPRGWFFCGQYTNSGLAPELEFEMMKGTVGEAAAGEYKAFLQVFRELPSVDAVKLDPEGTPISDKPAVRFAIGAALAAATTKDVFGRFMQYMGRMEPEWQITYVRDAQRRTNREICSTKEYIKFATTHSHLLA